MIGPWTRLRRGGVATFVVYLVTTLFALVPATTLTSALAGAADDARLFEPGGAVVLEAASAARWALATVGLTTMGLIVLTLLLSPLLTVTWLASMTRPRPFSESFGVGVRCYWASILLAIMLAPLAAGACALTVWLAMLVGEAFPSTSDPQRHAAAMLVGAIPGLLLLAHVAAWHDLGRAAIAIGAEEPQARAKHSMPPVAPPGTVSRAWRGFRAGARALIRGWAVPAYLIWLFIGAVLAVGAHALGWVLDANIAWMALALLAAQQFLALGRTLVRGRWLAGAVERALMALHGTKEISLDLNDEFEIPTVPAHARPPPPPIPRNVPR